MKKGKIVKVSGPLVIADNMSGSKMFDVVFVSDYKLMGEIIELDNDRASIQVYENTSGIGVGEPVYLTDNPLSVELGPGLLESIYDGTQRPLDVIRDQAGDFITRGIQVHPISRDKRWNFVPVVKKGAEVSEGDIIGEVQETIVVNHKIMIPPGISGKVVEIEKGQFKVEETVCIIDTGDKKVDITMLQKWPVRIPRPYKEKKLPEEPLVTGQRVIDTFFPIGKGGTACIPGPFGSGKTVTQHQLAKWADADVIVYVGCGERGNEMTDVLQEFPELKDPKSGEALMKRTVLIANTSNMPVAAREASVYTGITIAEYYRDMGYSVALMADSTSRWAEAMREISGRLEEMPGEEGYPAYLSARIASFYERAGRITTLGNDGREGALSVIGAVSPPGGDLSDPVVQATLRVVKVFWSLQADLAYRRHFPAIGWLSSYSLYFDNIKEKLKEEIGEDFLILRANALKLLEKEAELEEIVRLVGADTLSMPDQLVLEVARSIKEDFLHQNAFHEVDTYASMKKQYLMLKNILFFSDKAKEAIAKDIHIKTIRKLPIVEKISRMRYINESKIVELEKLYDEIDKELTHLINK